MSAVDYCDELFGKDDVDSEGDESQGEYCYSSGGSEVESEEEKPKFRDDISYKKKFNLYDAPMERIILSGLICGGYNFGGEYSLGCGRQISEKGYNFGREFNTCFECGDVVSEFCSDIWITPFEVPVGNNNDAQTQKKKAELKQPLKDERAMDLKQPSNEAEVVSAIVSQESMGKEKCKEQQKEEPMSKNRRREEKRKSRASTATGELNLGVSAGMEWNEMTRGEVTQNREKNVDQGSSYKMNSTFALSDEDATHISDTQVPERGIMFPTSLTVERGDSVFREKSSYMDADYLEVCEPAVLQTLDKNPRRVDVSLEICLTSLMEVLSRFIFARGAKKID